MVHLILTLILLRLRPKFDVCGRIHATSFKVIVQTEELVEVSFFRPWDSSQLGKLAPINIDKRFFFNHLRSTSTEILHYKDHHT